MMNGNSHKRMKLKISSLIFIVLIQNADIFAQKTERFVDFSKSIKANKKNKEFPQIKHRRSSNKRLYKDLQLKSNRKNDYLSVVSTIFIIIFNIGYLMLAGLLDAKYW